MRWFWLFILSLVLLTGVLYTLRVRAQRAAEAQLAELAQAAESMPQRRARRGERPRTPPPSVDSGPDRAAESDPASPGEPTEPDPQPEADPEAEPEPEPEPVPQPGGLPPPTGEIIIEGLPRPEPGRPAESAEPITSAGDDQPSLDEDEPAAEPQESAAPAATFELHDDGSFTVLSTNTCVPGTGTAADPYVLGWELLKSVRQVYDPKADKDEMPGWLDLLDGKAVRIEGHTLVPVIATTTRELLIMQNPWDGCCIGIPPSPYDAIEAALDHEVDFGNSAVGYGTIEGTFYLDPYVVDGWVLGLFIIEGGTYRSGEGVAFPEF